MRTAALPSAARRNLTWFISSFAISVAYACGHSRSLSWISANLVARLSCAVLPTRQVLCTELRLTEGAVSLHRAETQVCADHENPTRSRKRQLSSGIPGRRR